MCCLGNILTFLVVITDKAFFFSIRWKDDKTQTDTPTQKQVVVILS